MVGTLLVRQILPTHPWVQDLDPCVFAQCLLSTVWFFLSQCPGLSMRGYHHQAPDHINMLISCSLGRDRSRFWDTGQPKLPTWELPGAPLSPCPLLPLAPGADWAVWDREPVISDLLEAQRPQIAPFLPPRTGVQWLPTARCSPRWHRECTGAVVPQVCPPRALEFWQDVGSLLPSFISPCLLPNRPPLYH